jgi:hypothetical protein
MMLFLGMIAGGNTTLLLACAGGLINGRVMTLLLLADWVRLVTCNGKLGCEGGLIDGGKTMLFLGMINGSNTTLPSTGCE